MQLKKSSNRTLTVVMRIEESDNAHDAMQPGVQGLSDAATWIECSLGRSVEDIDVTVYEGDDSADGIAKREGWTLEREADRETLKIHKQPGSSFADNAHAVAHVTRLAEAGSLLHKEALVIHLGHELTTALRRKLLA